jgi:uncharacterized protein YcbX
VSLNASTPWRVSSLWCYPVKSMQGEEREELVLNADGVAGDRQYGVFDVTANTVLSAKREGRLLDAAAILSGDELSVTLPDGRSFSAGEPLDEVLTSWLGRRVRIVEASLLGAATYEAHEDFEHDDSPLVTWEGPRGSFVDESALHLMTTLDLDQLVSERPDLQWEMRRFRPNVLMEPAEVGPLPLEPGSRVALGECEIAITKGCTRCVMTTRSQPGALERQLEILRHVSRHHDGAVGVRASVVRRGTVRIGDPVCVLG